MKIPHWLIHYLPYFDYICPKCKKEVKKNSHKCPYCKEPYSKPLCVPPKVLKNPKALEDYVHKHILPKTSKSQREYLTQFFTEFLNSGWEDSGGSDVTDDWKWTSTAGSPLVVASPTHHGSYALECDSSGDIVIKTISATPTIFVRIYLRFDALPTTVTQNNFVRVRGSSSNIALLYTYRTSAGELKLWLSRFYPSGSSLVDFSWQINTWYCVELKFYKHATDGEYRVWVDGNEEIADIGLDTSSAPDIDEIRVGQHYTNFTVTNWIDCVVVADTYIGPEEEGVIYTETWQTDALFEKLGIQKSLNVGAAFKKSFTTHSQVDSFFQKLGVLESCGLDVYFGAVAAETYAKSCGLDVVFAYRVSFPELWFDEEGRMVLNLSKPCMWVGS